jgi:hypothetical protein
MIDMLAALFPEQTPDEVRRIGTSALATMMGAIVLARATGDKTTLRRYSCIRTADAAPSIHGRTERRADQHM